MALKKWEYLFHYLGIENVLKGDVIFDLKQFKNNIFNSAIIITLFPHDLLIIERLSWIFLLFQIMSMQYHLNSKKINGDKNGEKPKRHGVQSQNIKIQFPLSLCYETENI